jgi:hypothetical protein
VEEAESEEVQMRSAVDTKFDSLVLRASTMRVYASFVFDFLLVNRMHIILRRVYRPDGVQTLLRGIEHESSTFLEIKI